ncbi:MAG: prepilin-type N-terminal cleavage/methylation domain-containing protein [Candidatus Magasanikbacteria bacterium]|nr:prepilin-type N-terminal cleavage/methylation domain-containing protein [Candidatus Magasanikbacteria bacterium]
MRMNVKRRKNKNRGFTLIEVMAAIAVFVLFALGVYEGVRFIYKIVYISRVRILETAILSEELEIARNIPYASVGILGGIPSGLLTHTKTMNRNGIDFNVITTIRNIDDPFDGMATGTIPKDTSPADYKLVEISAICTGCSQKEPVILSTVVAPKNQEGATNNGSLYINVFDSTGAPVAEADVLVYNSSTSPTLSFEDVTDNDGWLRIVDVPTSTVNYHVIVTKDGYSTDYTATSSEAVLNPIKPPATVTSQNVTEIYFSIDRLGSLVVRTIYPSCGIAGSKLVSMQGEKRIGREPDVFKYDEAHTTNGSGDYTLSNAEWDKYWFVAAGTGWTLGGTVPMMPADLAAGASQEISLIVRPYSENYLLVNVQEAGTKLPLSEASVRLYGAGLDRTLLTGLGYSRQTDWSGGSGQVEYSNEGRYFSDDGNLETNSPAGDIKLRKIGLNYSANGWLESSTYDLGSSVNFQNIIFEPTGQPPETGNDSVRFQLATSNSSTPETWVFSGPDGTSASYYTAINTLIHDSHDGQRYLRYKIFLSTVDTLFSPNLSELSFTYTNSCLPPGQSYFDNLEAADYRYEITRSGYATVSGVVTVTSTPVINALMSAE